MNDPTIGRLDDNPPVAANDDAAPITTCLDLNGAVRALVEVVAPLVAPGAQQLPERAARQLLDALLATASQGVADHSGEQKLAIRRARTLLCYLARD